MVAAQEIVLERLPEQIEVLVEERLRRDVEGENRMGFMGSVAIDDTSELQYVLLQLRRRTEHALAVHVALYLGPLDFRRVFEPLGECLRREALVIDAFHRVADET